MHRADAAVVPVDLVAHGIEGAVLPRVQRSRLTLAMAITLAALPVIVLDNLPATASTDGERTDVAAGAHERSPGHAALANVRSSTTVAAPTSTAAPATTSPPETTTSEAPTTTEVVEAQPLRASTAAVPPTTTPPPAPPPTTPPGPGTGDPADPATWERLAQCESSGNWAMNSGNGYYGGLQFSLATWRNVGGAGYPHQATKAEQIKRGQILQARAGWDQWPHCSRELGF